MKRTKILIWVLLICSVFAKAQINKTLNVETAGTLRTLLTTEEKKTMIFQ